MYLIITASPNKDGLTAACGEAARRGVESAGGVAELVSLNAAGIESCITCGNGWGICREQHECSIDDAFADIKAMLMKAEGFFLITPVYWGETAEKMKYFLDRFRRCVATNREAGALCGKPASLVAAAGGSGNGTVSCLEQMELWCRHVQATPVDRIGVTAYNREEMLGAIKSAAWRMAKR